MLQAPNNRRRRVVSAVPGRVVLTISVSSNPPAHAFPAGTLFRPPLVEEEDEEETAAVLGDGADRGFG